jgi:DNA-binding Lrp family transcriptional regulator
MTEKNTIIDDFDKKILEFLQKNAKLTAKEMAFELALSQTPIYERIKKLERLGVIKEYVAILNADLISKGFVVFMSIIMKEHSQDKRTALVEKILSFKELSECYQTSGKYDFILKLRFSNLKEYREFLLDKISLLDNIGKIDSHIVLDEVKNTTYINL